MSYEDIRVNKGGRIETISVDRQGKVKNLSGRATENRDESEWRFQKE